MLDWLTTTTHHDLHHANGRWNLGFYFTHWDRWMGTEHPQYYGKFAQASAGLKESARTDSGRQQYIWKQWMLSLIVAGTSVAIMLHAPHATAGKAEQILELRSIADTWVSEGYAFVVGFGPCVESPVQLCGKLLWAWKPNAIAQKAWHRPILQGSGFREGYWRDGKLVHPQNGYIYCGKLRLLEKDTLILQGCVATILCDKQIWCRLNSLPHASGVMSSTTSAEGIDYGSEDSSVN